jgi:hypothetical protein
MFILHSNYEQTFIWDALLMIKELLDLLFPKPTPIPVRIRKDKDRDKPFKK